MSYSIFRNALSVVFALFLGVPHMTSGQSLVSNGDFSAGLDAWQRIGSVFAGGDAAILNDQGALRSTLYQGVAGEAGPYEFTFDFRNLLSDTADLGFALDALFVSIYTSATPADFNPLGFSGFDSAVAVADIDTDLVQLIEATLLPSASGPDFRRVEHAFVLSAATTIFLVFDLYDLNGVSNDSTFVLDHVSLVFIPEPRGGAALMGLLAAWFYLRRKRYLQ